MVHAAVAFAQNKYGDWLIGRIDGNQGFFAITANDSGGLFGQYCVLAASSCVYVVAFLTGCESGSRYPVLANTDAGSTQLEVKCDGQLTAPGVAGLYRYVFIDFDVIDKVVKGATRVGFAFPLHGDQFKVIRFSLKGANEAVADMRALTERNLPGSPSRRTRPDTTRD
ncbi:MAG: hypothetical protein JO292_01905 [Betaproteobacteria bacterium]|nr:hypothetical protein [Betaproteobacteria bacterium]